MIVGLLITNGGPHPPEKLAGATVQRFLDDFRAGAPQAAYEEVMRFQDEIDKILTDHHRFAQERERSALHTEGPDRIAGRAETDDHVADAMDDIMALIFGSPRSRNRVERRSFWGVLRGQPKFPSLQEYFERPETLQYFEEVLHREFHQNMMIERSWHADANPDHPAAIAFRSVQQNGHGLLAMHDDDLEPHGGRELVLAMVANTMPHCPSKGVE